MLSISERLIGVLILLQLSTGCICLSIGRESNRLPDERYPGPKPETIQICGPKLTSIIVDMCRGYVRSPMPEPGEDANTSGSVDYGGVVKLCCVNRCHRRDLLQHCGRNSNLTTMAAKEKVSSVGRSESKDERGNAKREAEVEDSGSRDVAIRTNDILTHKRANEVPRPFQVGTIKPVTYGGDPVVVGLRQKWARHRRTD